MSKVKLKKKQKNLEFQEIYGFHSVSAALQNTKRKHFCLFIIEKYKDLFKKYSIRIGKIKILTNKEMSKLFGNESVTQGIVLKSSPLPTINFEKICIDSQSKETSIIVVLDQVTDPYNIGSIMRSCALFQCKSIILPKDNAPDITPALSKAASGAVEMVNYVKVVNLKRSLQYLKKLGYWIYGLDNNANQKNKQIDLPKKCVLVVGSEGKGIREINKKECDNLIALPSQPNKSYAIDSLNVSSACAIALYEHFKKYNL